MKRFLMKPNGEKVLAWDFHGCGSWTATTIFIHADPCAAIARAEGK